MVPTKECKRCHAVKSLDEFARKKLNRDGRSGCCLACGRIKRREWEQRAKTRLCSVCQTEKPTSGFRVGKKHVIMECRDCEQHWRRCGRCREVRAIDDFGASVSQSSGRRHRCRACEKEVMIQFRSTPEGKAAAVRYYSNRKTFHPVSVAEKVCARCKEVKPASRYTPNPSMRTGLDSTCLDCRIILVAAHRQTEQYKAWRAVYQSTENFKERNRCFAARWRRLVAESKNDLTADDWLAILEEHGYACYYCGRVFNPELKPTQDHRTPVSKGGEHTRDNIVPACMHCNFSKKDRAAPVTLPSVAV